MYRRIHTDWSDPTILQYSDFRCHKTFSKTWYQGNMERHLARKTWCLGKLRMPESFTTSGCLNRENRVQRQVPWARSSTRQGEVPGSFKKTWVEKGFFSCQDLGLQVHQRQVAGTPGQIFEIDAGGDAWLVPWG